MRCIIYFFPQPPFVTIFYFYFFHFYLFCLIYSVILIFYVLLLIFVEQDEKPHKVHAIFHVDKEGQVRGILFIIFDFLSNERRTCWIILAFFLVRFPALVYETGEGSRNIL